MEAIDFLKPHVLLQCMQYSHVDMHITAQLMSGCPRRASRRLFAHSVLSFRIQTSWKCYDIPTKQLGKNMFVSQSRTLETSVFQAAPAPHRETSSPRYDSIEAAASDRNVV